MKLFKYIPEKILNTKLLNYKEHIVDYYSKNEDTFIYGQKRDNCGIIAADFALFMQSKGFNIDRVQGEFKNDTGVYSKLDFYKEELKVMKELNLDPNKLEDRMKFCDIKNLHDRQKFIPHYWCVDENSQIIDLSAYSQFVNKGMSNDIDESRYYINGEPVVNNTKAKQSKP